MGLYHSVCTVPPAGTATVASASIRGTFDILWTCFSILFLCTWSILYLNVPLQSRPQSWKQESWRSLYSVWSKVKWMAFNILDPEWPLAKAWSEYRSVSSFIPKFDEFLELDDVPWTRAHLYLANMGGFAIRFDSTCMPNHQQDLTSSTDSVNSPQHPQRSASLTAPESFVQIATTHPTSGSQPANVNGNGNSNEQVLEEGKSRFSSDLPSTSHNNTGSDLNTDALEYNDNSSSDQGGPQSQVTDPRQALANASDLRDWLKGRRFSAESTQASLQKKSKRIGLILWSIESANTKAVQRAAEIVNLSHFKNDAEKYRFNVSRAVWFDNLHALQGDLWILDTHQLLLAREMGIIERLPLLSEDDLAGRSRADSIVVLFAVGQILWFVIQLIARRVRLLPISQLEIVTLAFSVWAVLTYILLWDKPKDVKSSFVIKAARFPKPEELIRIAVAGPYFFGKKRRTIWIPNNAIHWESAASNARFGPMMHFNIGCAIANTIFGAIHCVAWSFAFPTLAEQRMWQVASILSVAIIPLMIALIVIYWSLVETKDGRSVKSKRGASMIFFPFAFLLLISRLFVIVEVFRSLAYLPSGAFVTTWASDWPHIG